MGKIPGPIPNEQTLDRHPAEEAAAFGGAEPNRFSLLTQHSCWALAGAVRLRRTGCARDGAWGRPLFISVLTRETGPEYSGCRTTESAASSGFYSMNMQSP